MRGLFRLLPTFLSPYQPQVLLVVTLLLIQSIANLYLPNLNADIINNGVVKGDIGYIWRIGGLMLALAAGVGVLAVVAVYFASRTSMSFGRDVRGAVFARVQQFSAQEMNRFGTASLITRNTNDVQQVQMFLQTALTMLVTAPIMGVGGVILAVQEDATLSWILVVIVPLVAAVIGTLMFFAVPLFQVMQVKIDKINQVLREQITGVRVIRAFNRTPDERERFEVANLDLTTTGLRVNRIFAAGLPVLLLIMNLSSVAIVWFGGHLIGSGSMPVGNLFAFLSYIMQIFWAMMLAVMMVIFVPRAAASASRLEQVLATQPSLGDPAEPIEPITTSGTIDFQAVSFGYPGGEKPVLCDLSFDVRPGLTTAIIGGTGSGKTTLLNLIPRFFDATHGAVLLNGVDVRRQRLETVWASIGLVPQQAYLFRGTIADNLRFGSAEASEADLWHALDIAQARDFVAALPEQLNAPVDQGGTNFSGGQKQRLAIARALVKRPAISIARSCSRSWAKRRPHDEPRSGSWPAAGPRIRRRPRRDRRHAAATEDEERSPDRGAAARQAAPGARLDHDQRGSRGRQCRLHRDRAKDRGQRDQRHLRWDHRQTAARRSDKGAGGRGASGSRPKPDRRPRVRLERLARARHRLHQAR
ncbi:MAG: ABC transporter ATP-binding protein [Chloroflexi bacterium]|nr:MAG: ABC transporter ATP-binding protein [Chloroflexota bacterium]